MIDTQNKCKYTMKSMESHEVFLHGSLWPLQAISSCPLWHRYIGALEKVAVESHCLCGIDMFCARGFTSVLLIKL